MRVRDTYEFFTSEFEFQGKHAAMCSKLWERNVPEHSYFQRLVDIYIFAPIIGFRMQHKSPIDTSTTDTRSIFSDQIRGAKDKLDFILQMILLQEYSDTLTPKECADIAFRGAETEEQFKNYNRIFNDYVRGGVEILYDNLVQYTPSINNPIRHDKTAGILHLCRTMSNDW